MARSILRLHFGRRRRWRLHVESNRQGAKRKTISVP